MAAGFMRTRLHYRNMSEQYSCKLLCFSKEQPLVFFSTKGKCFKFLFDIYIKQGNNLFCEISSFLTVPLPCIIPAGNE